ncbi:hypothetical protein ABVT39_023158 [Epinephelus coioides]
MRRTQLPVSVPSPPRQLDAVRVRRGESGAPPADQGERERGEESQQPQESESRTGWTPGGRPEREPRCHGRGLCSGNRAVKLVHTASRGRQVLWRAAGDGEAAVGEPHEAACEISEDPRSYYLLTVAV